MVEEFEVQKQRSDLISVEQQRAVQEVQAMMIIAKRFPRDVDACLIKIKNACKRVSLAEKATYVYPRGGKPVSGPSIRLAEIIAQNWENLTFGIRELSQSEGKSEIESFAWDLETNVRQIKTFSVKHQRKAKGKINVLEDPRDIYEHTANLGARRMRACILGIIPGDIVEAAEKQCAETLKNRSDKPLEDRIRTMLDVFNEIGVTKPMIEINLGHKTNAIIEQELINLGSIYNSIKDGMSKREDWFKIDEVKVDSNLKEAILGKDAEPSKPVVKDTKPATKDTEPPSETDGLGPWERKQWINLKTPGFKYHVNAHLNSLKQQPEIVKNEVRKKWVDDLKLPEPFPLDKEKPGPVEKPPAETEQAIHDRLRTEIIGFDHDEIKKACIELSLPVAVLPRTNENLQKLRDRLEENKERM